MTLIARATIRSLAAEFIIGVLLFASAGDLAWWPGWAYMVVLVLSTLLPLLGPFRLDEGLIEERMSRKPGAKQWDRYFVALVGLFTVAEIIVSGSDHRWMWTPPQPVWKHLVGVGLIIFGSNWAFIVAGLFMAMFIVRTMLEDRVLQQELPGYREYAERVTWKLVQGIW